jgi:phenylpropionate dioxygenase-like ring-hydroxylating dioxygenase large terminal subunit
MRRYWIPALLSWELAEPDCPPVEVRLLGEELVAFRTTDGTAALIDAACPHRRVNLFWGRNEENGLRCVYHGWKFDATGQCVDMPSEPASSNFKDRVRVTAYPTYETGGVVWAYMGPAEKKPEPPLYEWTQVPPEQRGLSKVWEECNWLQSMEGGIDAGHAPILHRAINPATQQPGGFRGMRTQPGFATTEEVEPTNHGVMSARLSELSDGKVWVRINQFVMPFHTFFPAEIYDPKSEGGIEYKPFINGHIFVPMDDENTMTYNWIGRFAGAPFSADEIRAHEHAKGRGEGELLANFRKKRNQDNDWLIDRRIQKTETYTGIAGNHNQDHAVQESMGPIVDRTKENLVSTDNGIIMARHRLIRAAKAFVEKGVMPPGIDPEHQKVRSVAIVLPADVPYKEGAKEALKAKPGVAPATV